MSGDATNGTDYDELTGTVTIEANQTSILVHVKARRDTTGELNEAAVLSLVDNGNKYNRDMTAASAAVIITDNDVLLSLSGAGAQWNAATKTLTLTRPAAGAGPVSAAVTLTSTIGGSAASQVFYNSGLTQPEGSAPLRYDPLQGFTNAEGHATILISVHDDNAAGTYTIDFFPNTGTGDRITIVVVAP